MQNAMWLASIFGPFLTIMGLWMLLYSENLIKVWNALKSAPASFCHQGMINILVGLGILSQYDQWTADVSVLVTLLGWVLLIRGVLILFVPQAVFKFMMGRQKMLKMLGIIPLVWGLILVWFAFFM